MDGNSLFRLKNSMNPGKRSVLLFNEFQALTVDR